MDVKIRLFSKDDETAVKLHLTGNHDEQAKAISISKIEITSNSGGFSGEATLKLTSNVVVHKDKLLKPINDSEYRFLSPREASENNVAGLLADLRRKLAAQKLDLSENTFLDLPIGGASLEGTVSITVPLDGQGEFAIEAKAKSAVNVNINLTNYAQNVNVGGQFIVGVRFTERDVRASLETILHQFPNLGFSLREIKLPNLSFNNLSLDLDHFSPINIPLPNWLDGLLTISGGTPYTFSVKEDGFELSAGSAIRLVIPGHTQAALTIGDGQQRKFKVTKTGETLTIEGDVLTSAEFQINKTFNFNDAGFPILGGVTLGNASFKLIMAEDVGNKVEIKWNIPRFSIEAVDDPGSRIAVAFELISTTNITNGKTTWKFSNPVVLDIRGNLHIPDIDFSNPIDGRIRICIGSLVDGAEEFLRRLLRLLAALVRYLGKALGPIPGLLSDLAEALADLLAQGLQALLDALKTASGYVILELRLDASTLRPVQLIVTFRGVEGTDINFGGSLLKVSSKLDYVPGLILDFENNWQGLAMLCEPAVRPNVTVSTNLWLESETGQNSAIPEMKEQKQEPLIKLTATMQNNRTIVVAALQHGRAKFFQTFGVGRSDAEPIDLGIGTAGKISSVGKLTDLEDLVKEDVSINFEANQLENKLLALMPQGPKKGDEPSDLAQVIKIDGEPTHDIAFPEISVKLRLKLFFADLEIPFQLEMNLNVLTFHFKLKTGDELYVTGELEPMSLLGFSLDFVPKKDDQDKKLFKLSFKDGDMSLALAEGTIARLRYDRLSSNGGGLELKATKFKIGRGGLDLTALTVDKPVRLGGLDQPFRFKNGSISIQGGKLLGGTISGYGPMPPALIGEANAEIDLVFGQRNGRFALIAANAKLEKEGEPLYSTGTKFKITLDALGLAFREPEVGPVQFYFQLWGSAAFSPGTGEFDGGMLKNMKSVVIRLDGAPLTGDGRELAKHISFLVELDPPVRKSLFDVFDFEIRGIAFYPASKAWADNPPAIGIAGQISFLEAGDVVSSEINFHELLISVPEPGGNVPLPRIRADGLSVLLRVGGIAQIEATAVAVDGSIPSLYAPVKLPANVRADGFLAAGRVDLVGLGAYGGAMGFLELRKEIKGKDRIRHAMFLYGQGEKLTERIDTPIGPLFIREVGFGFGKNYTLTAIAAADNAKTPREMVKQLDEVSKLQGNLMNFSAWTPQYEKNLVTLALRGMISMAATSKNSASYDEKGEKDISNPLLMDIVLAIRTDLTFFANVRGWIAFNYHDWFSAGIAADFKQKPTLRGYLYFSVPRKEMLARFISDKTGEIGKHPELPENLENAIKSTRFSSTLYIRPGLYHAELGWPYELGFELGKTSDDFYLNLSGGLVLRIEDATMLYGVAFKALGHMQFEGKVGNSRFGASVVARADFLLGARFIAYITPLKPRDTLFYGEIFLNVTLKVAVAIWMSFKIFTKRFTIKIGFSIMLTISVAAEVVFALAGIGARVHAAIGVRGFGRSLSVGVGFSFNDNQLSKARARVARFMDLGLGIDPPKDNLLQQSPTPAPAPEVPRKARAENADTRLNEVVPQSPETPPVDPNKSEPLPGEPITASDFWALLFLADDPKVDNPTYLMVLVPKDHSSSDEIDPSKIKSTFFAEPVYRPEKGQIQIPDGGMGKAHYKIKLHESEGSEENAICLKHLRWEKVRENNEEKINGIVEPLTLSKEEISLSVLLEKKVGSSEFGSIDLNFILAECFLDPPEINQKTEEQQDGELQAGERQPAEQKKLKFGEPIAIKHGNPAQPDPSSARTGRVKQSSRNKVYETENLKVRERLEASLIVEEKRSALITKIGESAFEMAAEWRMNGDASKFNSWPFDSENLTAPEFGLSFLVKEEDLNTLFNLNRAANFQLKKRVLKEDEDDEQFEPGVVTLLNHPDDAFVTQQPRLDQARVEVHQDGFRLYWDLEPAFGSSEDTPFEKDPETLLAHYLVERSFEGTENGWIAEFKTRTGTPLEYEVDRSTPDKPKINTKRSRAQMHLCDDFSRGGIPEDVRALLFGLTIPSGRSAQIVWDEAFGADRSTVGVVYKVTAVDIMGTSTGQRVIEKTVERPALRTDGPISAELSVEYEEMGTLGASRVEPTLSFALIYRDDKPSAKALGTVYQLRVRGHKLKGGGQYGADAVDDSSHRPSQLDINAFRDDLDQDVFLKLDNAGPIDLRFPTEKGEEQVKDRYPPKFAVYATLADLLNNKTVDEADQKRILFIALRIPEGESKPEELRACRVFLRELGTEKMLSNEDSETNASPWLIAQTQLVVNPKEKEKKIQPYTATVELLETPLHVLFLALEQQQIEREAGRLELVYPGAGSTFGDLVENKSNITERRLDPDRRSAIQLKFNVSGAKTSSGFKGSPLNGLIAGFDIFAADPARLRMRASEKLTPKVVEEECHKRATVKVLPRSLAGLFPDALPNFRSIDVRYPSDTRRTDPVSRKGRNRAPWYSGAESLVVFPSQRLRRTLFPTPEEPMISTLLDEFVALEVEIALEAPEVSDTVRDDVDWKRINKLVLESTLEHESDLVVIGNNLRSKEASQPDSTHVFSLAPKTEKSRQYILTSPNITREAGIKGHEMRALLRGLVLTFGPNLEGEYKKWRRDGSADHLSTAFRVKVAITVRGKNEEHRETETVEVDLTSPIHPVLADTLDALCYETYGNEPGQVYRAYEVVREPVPPTESKGFDAFLDGHAPAGDPYGWSALRALGLASGFRLYNIDEGRFLSGIDLFARVNNVFKLAIKRYFPVTDSAVSGSLDDVCNLGHPFVELVDLPETFMAISSPDGRAQSSKKDTTSIANGGTSILQIGLRPRPSQQIIDGPVRYLVAKAGASVRYLTVALDKFDKLGDSPLELPLGEGAVFDFINLPLLDDEDWSRFVGVQTRSILSLDDTSIPEKANVALNKLAGTTVGQICFVVRIAAVEKFDFSSCREDLRKVLSDRGLSVSRWLERWDKYTQPDLGSFQTLGESVVKAVKAIDEKINIEVTLDPPSGAIWDFVGLPLAEGGQATRFCDENTTKALFPPGTEMPKLLKVALNSFKTKRLGEVCFVLRITQTNTGYNFDGAREQIKGALGEGFDVDALIENPTVEAQAVFDTFSPIDPPLLAALMGRRSNTERRTSLDTLLSWLPPQHVPDELIITNDENTIDASRIARVSPLATRVAEWTARFLSYGSDQDDKDTTEAPKIRFALAALTSEESFARVPDVNGRVSAFFIDPSRVGREHYFAIRPFGRYTGIEAMIGGDSERLVTMEGGLSGVWQHHFAAVSIDRSKPLEAPAILAARLDKSNEQNIELIVARTPDQIASEANLIAERALQGAWTGLELRATYARTDHAKKLLGKDNFDPFEGFNEAAFGGADQQVESEVKVITSGQLNALRSIAPDAWRGSIRYELTGVPHFFDTMALVHQSAGVVVSDVAALPLPRTGTKNRFPPFKKGENDVRTNDGWKWTYSAKWGVTYVENEDGKQVAVISFDLPMMRNLDLMTQEDLMSWTNGDAERVAPVYRLPNPDASYRVSTVSKDFSSASSQIEILPVKEADNDKALYIARLAGDRFEKILEEPQGSKQDESEWNWRLTFKAKFSETDENESAPAMPVINIVEEMMFEPTTDQIDPVAWARWAPERSFAFTIGADEVTQDVLDGISAELLLFQSVPGVRAILDALQEPSKGKRVEGSLPLGQIVPNISGLEPETVSISIGRFVWPADTESLECLTRAQHKAYVAAAENLSGGDTQIVKDLLNKLEARWSLLHKTGKGGTRAKYESVKIVEQVIELSTPFTQFEMVRFSKASGQLDSDDRDALIEAVQEKFGDPYLAARAVEILNALVFSADQDQSQVTIPIPVGTQELNVNDLEESHTGQYASGFHWLPEDDEMKNLSNENPLLPMMYRLRREVIFGVDATPRVTGFSGSGDAAVVDIHQNGEM